MAKRNNKQSRRIRNLVLLCSICAVVLVVSTYAWFIGMKTVNVSSFDIEIATTEGLFLSMNGNDWYYNLNPNTATAYTGNTNTWASNGLIPMSTVGDMDPVSSRMKLYEKASLTTSHGGYRLLASRVQNYATAGDDKTFVQGEGYVAFDLFIKNLSGTEYYEENEPLNEEAIYLTVGSKVEVASDGVKNTGIENSVRVAFAQVGRVKADTSSVETITGITCAKTEDEDGNVIVTGICRPAQIWEPNDKDHVQNAINWYNKSCLARTGADLTLKTSYVTDSSDSCNTISPNTAYATYAVSRELTVDDNVDIYDGTDYNNYENNTKKYASYIEAKESEKNNYKLVEYDYFTDTEKMVPGAARPEFMKLAPNSITKLRVYIYIEGQDIDNYDFASIGKKISVNFGFTKERFEKTDVSYTGPSFNVPAPSNNIVDDFSQN